MLLTLLREFQLLRLDLWYALDTVSARFDTIDAIRTAYIAHLSYYKTLLDAAYVPAQALRVTKGASDQLRW